MGQYVAKVLLTAIIIVAVSELGKRSSFLGAVVASLPLTSLLALAWLHVETGQTQLVSNLAMGIFWMVIPSLAFFPLLVWLLRHLAFWWALLGASAATAMIYVSYVRVAGYIGIKI